jgi:lysophospholipase L1-like esterase
MMKLSTICLLLVAPSAAHEVDFPINPVLGVPGFPDCVRAHPEQAMTVDEAAMDLICSQKEASADAIKIGCVGDSITAGVHSSGGIHPYPQQLQIILDQKQGKGKYSVTNMGACGSMMLKNSSSPFWKRPQYKTLTAGKWDIIIIMLGTNDAHNTFSSDWKHDCGGPNHTTLDGCQFAEDYKSMIELVKTLGTTAAGPKVYVMTPPPLMSEAPWVKQFPDFQTTCNSIFPKLIPLIQKANPGALGPIDVYSGMGGVTNWQTKFPASCVLNSTWPTCPYFCDKQSCDQCHPDDNGYTHLANVVYTGLGLSSA